MQTNEIKRIDHHEFIEQAKTQKLPPEHIAVICPKCGVIQSAHDFIIAGVGDDYQSVAGLVGKACIGIYDDDFPPQGNDKKMPCKFYSLSKPKSVTIEVVFDDGFIMPSFELATTEQAHAHALKQLLRTPKKLKETQS